jgi:hypothetical protein
MISTILILPIISSFNPVQDNFPLLFTGFSELLAEIFALFYGK